MSTIQSMPAYQPEPTDGALCFVPESAQNGDHLVMPEACRLPVVLRQNAKEWTLMGEAYISNYIHAKSIDQMRDEEFATQIYTIC